MADSPTAQFGSLTSKDFIDILKAAYADQKITINGQVFDGARTVAVNEFSALYQQVINPDERSQAIYGYLSFPSTLPANQSIKRLIEGGELEAGDKTIAKAGAMYHDNLKAGKTKDYAHMAACLLSGGAVYINDTGGGCNISNKPKKANTNGID